MASDSGLPSRFGGDVSDNIMFTIDELGYSAALDNAPDNQLYRRDNGAGRPSPVSTEGRKVPRPAHIAGRGPAPFPPFVRPAPRYSQGRIGPNSHTSIECPSSAKRTNSFSRSSRVAEQHVVAVRRVFNGGFSLRTRFSAPEHARSRH